MLGSDGRFITHLEFFEPREGLLVMEAAACAPGALVSEMHCNFLINTGGATATDIEGLGEEVRRRVLATTGISLHWEIRRIGLPVARGDGGRT